MPKDRKAQCTCNGGGVRMIDKDGNCTRCGAKIGPPAKMSSITPPTPTSSNT